MGTTVEARRIMTRSVKNRLMLRESRITSMDSGNDTTDAQERIITADGDAIVIANESLV